MAASVYKWLSLPLLALLIQATPARAPHPLHVSVVEVNHNAGDKTLEISVKIFTDDFEKVLAQNYKTKVDLINPPDHKAMDSLVKKYVISHFSVTADGRPMRLNYVGFEHEAEAVYSYFQADNVPVVHKVSMYNKIMHDMFTDQINLMHVIVGGNRKSTKLDYPAANADVEF